MCDHGQIFNVTETLCVNLCYMVNDACVVNQQCSKTYSLSPKNME